MPQPADIAKAELTELWPDSTNTLVPMGRGGNPLHTVRVQFNPQTLKTNYSNQNVNADKGNSPVQFVGKGTTKLTMELWFDATRTDHPGAELANGDVRNLTNRIKYFITPQKYDPSTGDLAPPGVRFVWGSLLFSGVMDAMDETIELFSEEGVPLRASVSIGISQQQIVVQAPSPFTGLGSIPGAGANPLQAALANQTVQQIAALAGVSDWQRIAAANGIENPRMIPPGTLLNMSPR